MFRRRYFFSFEVNRKNGDVFSNGQGIVKLDHKGDINVVQAVVMDHLMKECQAKGVAFSDDATLHVLAFNRI